VPGRELRGLVAFPFDHRIEVAAELAGTRLTIATTLTAFDAPVPICFGHHPYLQLPDVPSAAAVAGRRPGTSTALGGEVGEPSGRRGGIAERRVHRSHADEVDTRVIRGV
jgi:aldose 1-epimerase